MSCYIFPLVVRLQNNILSNLDSFFTKIILTCEEIYDWNKTVRSLLTEGVRKYL